MTNPECYRVQRHYDEATRTRQAAEQDLGSLSPNASPLAVRAPGLKQQNGGSARPRIVFWNIVAVVPSAKRKTCRDETETLAAFHSRLVESHQALFGNLLASRIEDDGRRWDTLEGLALHGAELS